MSADDKRVYIFDTTLRDGAQTRLLPPIGPFAPKREETGEHRGTQEEAEQTETPQPPTMPNSTHRKGNFAALDAASRSPSAGKPKLIWQNLTRLTCEFGPMAKHGTRDPYRNGCPPNSGKLSVGCCARAGFQVSTTGGST